MAKRSDRRKMIQKTVRGSAVKPRLVVFRSNRYLYAQVIDDTVGKTLASVNKLVDAGEAGKKIAEEALKVKIKTVVFDRAGYKYHGLIKKLADAAREAGLTF